MVNLESILFPSVSDKHIKLVIVITIAFLITDTMISTTSDFLVPHTTSRLGVSYFVVLVIVFAISQNILIRFVARKTREIRSKSSLISSLLKIVIGFQYILLGILIIILYQVIFTSQYYAVLLIWSTVINFLLAGTLIGILARQFFIWYRFSKRNSIIILSYASAFVIISLTYTTAAVLDVYHISSKPDIVTPKSEVVFPDYDNAGRLLILLHYIYNYSDLVSFILIWGATALLLLNYRRRLGLVKFWIMITVPLIYYLSTFLDTTGLYNPQSDPERFYYYLYYSLNTTAGGLMFGIAFLVIANRIDNQNIKGYMTLAAYGFVLFYISGQITLAACSYPPFGIATLSFSGLSAFLLLTGLYSTAISLSRHAELRKSIRNSIADQHSKLIDRIGMSEMQRDIDKRIKPLIQRYAEQMDAQTAIDATISEKEVKQYIGEILSDLYKK
jgi:MFS family permease